MVELKVEIKSKEVKKRLGSLQHRSSHVIARAANRSIRTGETAIKRKSQKVYRVKQEDVEKVLRVNRATSKNPHARFTFKDTHQNLAKFSSVENTLSPRTPVRSTDPYNPNPAYYKAKIMRGGRAIALRGDPKPFVQFAGKNKEAILLRRKNKSSRAPLQGVAAPAMPQILKNEEIIEEFEEKTAVKFQERLEHEIDAVLKGYTY